MTQSLKPAAIALGIEIDCGEVTLNISFMPQQPDFVVLLDQYLTLESNDMDDVNGVPVALSVIASLSSYSVVPDI